MEHTETFHTAHHNGLNVGRGKLLGYTRIHVHIIVIHINCHSVIVTGIVHIRSAVGGTMFESQMGIEK